MILAETSDEISFSYTTVANNNDFDHKIILLVELLGVLHNLLNGINFFLYDIIILSLMRRIEYKELGFKCLMISKFNNIDRIDNT